eukprot:COSAG02_NODE_2506_length_8652_cov_226.221677_5_plen_162_part_00
MEWTVVGRKPGKLRAAVVANAAVASGAAVPAQKDEKPADTVSTKEKKKTKRNISEVNELKIHLKTKGVPTAASEWKAIADTLKTGKSWQALRRLAVRCQLCSAGKVTDDLKSAAVGPKFSTAKAKTAKTKAKTKTAKAKAKKAGQLRLEPCGPLEPDRLCG